jgi:hypothetical protein
MRMGLASGNCPWDCNLFVRLILSSCLAFSLVTQSRAFDGQKRDRVVSGFVGSIRYIDAKNRPRTLATKFRYSDLADIESVTAFELIDASQRAILIGVNQRTVCRLGVDAVKPPHVLCRTGSNFRPVSVRVELDHAGDAKVISSLPNLWTGELLDVSVDGVSMFGIESVASIGEEMGHFDWIDAPRTYFQQIEGSQELDAKVDTLTRFCLNLDPISRSSASNLKGMYSEVTVDCNGVARYVDIFRMNGGYSFSADEFPLTFRDVKDQSGLMARKPDAFVEQFSRAGQPLKLQRVSPSVKAYGPSREKLDWFNSRGPGPGFVGVWIDPKSRLITHMFLSLSEE